MAIYRGITTNNAAMTMCGSLLIAVLALVVDFVLGLIEKRINKRSEKARRTNRAVGAVAALACAALVCVSLFTGGKAGTINIATKPMTEQYILGEALDILIEQDTDLNVELTQGVGGGTSNIQPAMESGGVRHLPRVHRHRLEHGAHGERRLRREHVRRAARALRDGLRHELAGHVRLQQHLRPRRAH